MNRKLLLLPFVLSATIFGLFGFMDGFAIKLALATGSAHHSFWGDFFIWFAYQLSPEHEWYAYTALGSFGVATLSLALYWKSLLRAVAAFAAPTLILFELGIWLVRDSGRLDTDMPLQVMNSVRGLTNWDVLLCSSSLLLGFAFMYGVPFLVKRLH
jgi:hypothetical protein